jgi:integrase
MGYALKARAPEAPDAGVPGPYGQGLQPVGHRVARAATDALARVPHGMPHFTIHDLRRSARTHLAALGVRREVAERCLGHKLKGLEGTYDHHDYPSRGAYLGCSQHCYAPFATGGGRTERSTVHQGCCSRARVKAQVS